MGNFENFRNGLQTHITRLCRGLDPGGDVGVARAWFRDKLGPQPAEVNDWVQKALQTDPGPPDLTWLEVGLNGEGYHGSVVMQIEQLIAGAKPAPSSIAFAAWHWFQDIPIPGSTQASANPMAPDDVLDWIVTILPKTGSGSSPVPPVPPRAPVVVVPAPGDPDPVA